MADLQGNWAFDPLRSWTLMFFLKKITSLATLLLILLKRNASLLGISSGFTTLLGSETSPQKIHPLWASRKPYGWPDPTGQGRLPDGCHLNLNAPGRMMGQICPTRPEYRPSRKLIVCYGKSPIQFDGLPITVMVIWWFSIVMSYYQRVYLHIFCALPHFVSFCSICVAQVPYWVPKKWDGFMKEKHWQAWPTSTGAV